MKNCNWSFYSSFSFWSQQFFRKRNSYARICTLLLQLRMRTRSNCEFFGITGNDSWQLKSSSQSSLENGSLTDVTGLELRLKVYPECSLRSVVGGHAWYRWRFEVVSILKLKFKRLSCFYKVFLILSLYYLSIE